MFCFFANTVPNPDDLCGVSNLVLSNLEKLTFCEYRPEKVTSRVDHSFVTSDH